jgi:hypothetical protein
MRSAAVSTHTYNRHIYIARKVVAAAFAVCGAGSVYSANRIEWLEGVMRGDAGLWGVAAAVFGVGTHICLAAVCGLIIEALFRRWKRSPLLLRHLAVIAALGIGAYVLMIIALYSSADHTPHKGGPRALNANEPVPIALRVDRHR